MPSNIAQGKLYISLALQITALSLQLGTTTSLLEDTFCVKTYFLRIRKSPVPYIEIPRSESESNEK